MLLPSVLIKCADESEAKRGKKTKEKSEGKMSKQREREKIFIETR